MQQREQPLERGERRGLRVLVAGVEPRLDRLRVPVAEVVEGEVVGPLDRVGEVERGEVGLQLGARRVDAGDDPALLERRAAAAPASTPSACVSRSRDTFQSLFASRRPSSIGCVEKRTSWPDDIFRSP